MSDPAIASAELREVADGQLGQRRDTYPLAPYLEGDALERYIRFKNVYPQVRRRDQRKADGDLPAVFEQTAYCKRLVGAHGSARAARAVQEGNLPVLSYMTGLTRTRTDLSSAQELTRLLGKMRRAGFLAQFAGSTDGGKTNTAFVMAGLALLDDPEMQLATNVSTLDWRDEELNSRTHLVESRTELEELAETYDDVFAVLDEMSQHANAQTSNYEVNEELYPLITSKSKLGLRLVIIGHRESGHDIAPAIREHATYFVRQVREEHEREPDEYRAEFYDELEDGDLAGHQFDVEPVPALAGSYDPDEQSTFAISA